MTSYTFNSNSLRLTRSRLLKLYVLTAVLVVFGFVCLEVTVRYRESLKQPDVMQSASDLMAALPNMSISGRELGNQMLIQNVALFSQYPDPAEITSAYVGTSRSKILHPSQFGIPHAVVGAGNTYNEITYGLLLQAEIQRLKFPNLKRVYVESSFLLRRPGRLMVETDHLKYLPLLKTLTPLCSKASDVPGCQDVFVQAGSMTNSSTTGWKPEMRRHRSEFRFSSLLPGAQNSIPVKSDPLLGQLEANGETKGQFRALTEKAEMRPEISNDNIKAQRLRDITSDAPWDGLFDMFALWGREHGIQVVLFQPPVRSDLYAYQVKYGLKQHVDDLLRVSDKYQIPFVDLNRPELGYMSDWSLFSDEDHMATCVGSGLLLLALEAGVNRFEQKHDLTPVIERSPLEGDSMLRLSSCKK
ncbi:hypothetical protein EDF87_108148 [Pseudomonas helmanticensis]|uniref:Uncharacterized protein n=1 Tax=Pseudomonas helmanticensis TaxID=1471381 RepID=A0A4R7VAG0_9PSED|nr:hypothetical protein [Pseudomonas helmanticensis]TDV45937.1 hypothetical protein EDF87_108148 [Pseudomonas helmanticensis]